MQRAQGAKALSWEQLGGAQVVELGAVGERIIEKFLI